jgi:hypothetical protein
LRNDGCVAVGDALVHCRNLRFINLQRNHIQGRGAMHLATSVISQRWHFACGRCVEFRFSSVRC